MKKLFLLAALVGMIATSVSAGWQPVSFVTGSGDAVYYQVSTKLGQDFFTICKSFSGYRAYITFQGVGYEEFKASVVSWKAATKPSMYDSSAEANPLTGVTLTDATFSDASGNLTFGIYLADKFTRNGKRPKLSVVVMPNPAPNAHNGGSPSVTVTANNCDVSGVRVVYAPRPCDGSAQLAPVGTVSVNTGTIETPTTTKFGKNVGNVGTIHVMGGLFGASNVRGNIGTLLSEARVCTIKPSGTKTKVLQGGSLGGALITSGGNIGTISARNGLVGGGDATVANRIVAGYAATPKTYSSTANVGKIVVKRGWDKPCVVAGSEFNGAFNKNAPAFYNGGIALFRVNNKGDGTYTSQTGGCFTSAVEPRVVGKQKSAVSGNNIFVQSWGKTDLSNFVK